MDALGPEAERLYATLRFAEESLSEELRPLLIPLALHEQYIQPGMLEIMAKQVDENWTKGEIDSFLQALSIAGLLRNITGPIYQLHPALTGFLRSTLLNSVSSEIYDKWSRAFVDVMGRLADQLAPKGLHEQRFDFHIHGANFRFALSEAERLKMYQHYSALLQSIAAYATNTRNYSEAGELLKIFANIEKEKGNKKNEAITYHQLGGLAEEQRDFAAAEKWYLKSLEITEKLNIEHVTAKTYHQLGRIAQEKREFAAAEKWYLKSLEISEKLGNEHGAAITYHQLGIIAGEQRDFTASEKWCLKSLAITEKQGDEHGAAKTYNQLGTIAQDQRDFTAAEKWYLKSLAITEKQGNEHGAALTYNQLGVLSGKQEIFEESGRWLIKAIVAFINSNDNRTVKTSANNFMSIYRNAPDEVQAKLKAMWEEADLGPFPEVGDSPK